MLFEQVPDATRMLERIVGFDETVLAHFVIPGRLVVAPFLLIVTSEQAVLKAVAFLYDVRRVCKRLHIFPLHLAVGNAVIDYTQEEGDIAALPDRRIEVRDRGRP